MIARNARTILAVLALCGCASSPGASPGGGLLPGEPRVKVYGDQVYYNLTPESHSSSGVVAAPAERVWPLLAEVYRELGIPVTTADPAARMVGNPKFTARGRVGRVSMPELVDCGTEISGPRALTHRITFHIATTLEPADADQVTVQTTISASARSVDGSSGRPQPCTTTGVLERQIVERLRGKLAA